jgi:hypothetical protein
MRSSQRAGFIKVRIRSLQVLAAASQQLLAPRYANAPTIAIDRVEQGRLPVPAPPAAFRFREIRAQADAFPVVDALRAVVPLVRDNFPVLVAIGLDRVEFVQRP